jgi:hypothetical protein
MQRETDGIRLAGRHGGSLALCRPCRACPPNDAVSSACGPLLSTRAPCERLSRRVLMAVRLRCQDGCPPYMTAGPDNSQHLPVGPATE